MDPLSLGFGNVVVLNSTATKIRHCSLSANVLIRSMANLTPILFLQKLGFPTEVRWNSERNKFRCVTNDNKEKRIDIYKKG